MITEVRFGDTPASDLTVVSDTELTCITPSGAAGVVVDVDVEGPGGIANLPNGFTYEEATPAAVNLLTADESTLEAGWGGWSGVTGEDELDLSTDIIAREGAASLKVTHVSGPVAAMITVGSGVVTPAMTYTFMVSARYMPGGVLPRCQLVWIDAGGQPIGEPITFENRSASDDWFDLWATLAAPSGAHGARVHVGGETGGPEVAHIDRAGVFEGVVATEDWVPGTT